MGTNDGTSGTIQISKKYPIRDADYFTDPLNLIPESSVVYEKEKEGLN